MEKQFEIGKWYKIILSGRHPHIFKYKGMINDENVSLDKDHYDLSLKKWQQCSVGFSIEKLTDIKEMSLSEIQEYLPEDHIDKFPKESLLTNIL